ncbi:MAG: LysE family translocator [Sphaerotilus natans subsp. sulfidivorans]|uniref:LysE family translocator n=1 Tax=Sphaerotilus sulfidivorans TaxID=639200 RepID=UPI002354458E|nr:LysE family translocator [Sphaerotilus sulfidivorans]MCK6402353.1 LysE family translocator [Sphaerotilus sulfidivorans]
MTWGVTPEFLLAATLVVLMPGPGLLFTLSVTLAHGLRAGLWAGVGGTLGTLPHLALTVMGVSGAVTGSASAWQILRLVGAAYLLYTAFSLWRQRHSAGPGAATASGRGSASAPALLAKSVLMNLLNPKLTFFLVAFLPQFVGTGTPADEIAARLLVLGVVFAGLTLAGFVAVSLLAHRLRGPLLESPRLQTRLHRGLALVFAVLGLRLALEPGPGP